MCGIFGSFDLKTFEQLYVSNKQRGTFACGTLYVGPPVKFGYIKERYVRKSPGTIDLTGDYAFEDQYDLFLGHTQAPTSVARDFNPITSHPFDSLYYHVAHNGVLENMDDIVRDQLGEHDNPVDSSTIPALLSLTIEFDDAVYDESEQGWKTPELIAIEKSFEIIKGTFACWIHSKLTGDTYLVRSGSTLYGNLDTGAFSSVRVPTVCEDELQEGVVYCVTCEGLTKCGVFKTDSPFFL